MTLLNSTINWSRTQKYLTLGLTQWHLMITHIFVQPFKISFFFFKDTSIKWSLVSIVSKKAHWSQADFIPNYLQVHLLCCPVETVRSGPNVFTVVCCSFLAMMGTLFKLTQPGVWLSEILGDFLRVLVPCFPVTSATSSPFPTNMSMHLTERTSWPCCSLSMWDFSTDTR